MSRLSVHYNDSGNQHGFGDFLKKCHDAGSPVGVIYSLNGDIAPTIADNSPGTKWVYRRQSDGWQRINDAFFNADPVQNATDWLTKPREKGQSLLDIWHLNPADWFDPLNEPVIELARPDDPAQVAEMVRRAEFLNTWMLTALKIAADNGFKLAMFSFPFGSPPYEAWSHLVPALKRAKELGGILSLHSYTEDGPLLQRNADGTFNQFTLDRGLRHRRIYASLPPEARLPLLYSECSPNNGYGMGLSGQKWVNVMGEYDTELFKDDYIIGLDAFQLGGDESNLVSVLDRYADYISAHPTPGNPGKSASSADGMMVTDSFGSIIDEAGNQWTLGSEMVHGRAVLKNGQLFADGQGTLLLYFNRQIFAQNDLNEWWVVSGDGWQAAAGDPRP